MTILYLRICIPKSRHLNSKNPDKIRVYAEHIFFMFLLWRKELGYKDQIR